MGGVERKRHIVGGGEGKAGKAMGGSTKKGAGTEENKKLREQRGNSIRYFQGITTNGLSDLLGHVIF